MDPGPWAPPLMDSARGAVFPAAHNQSGTAL
jgi:hypothetical protein